MKTVSIKTRDVIHRTALAVVLVSSVFLLAVVMIMLLQYRQIKRTEPLNSPALSGLRERYIADERGNEQLKEQIRQLDLLSRRAWFTGQDQLYTGGFLIIGGMIVLLTALQTAASSRPFPDTPPGGGTSTDRAAARARTGIAIGAGAVLLLAVATVFLVKPFALPAAKARAAVTPQPAETPAAPEEFSRNWPFFRGPDTIGTAGDRKLPGGWDGKTGKGILWKSEIPLQGYNSPVVWGNRVFVSGGNKKLRELYCFNTADGKLLWRLAADNIPGSPATPPEVAEDTGFAAPTMAADGRRVFAVFATGDLVCAGMDGKRLWAVNLGSPQKSLRLFQLSGDS